MPSPSPNIAQAHRVQYLLEWLKAGKRFTAQQAADEFQVTRRTIAADFNYLRHAGVPLEYDPKRRAYVLTEPFENLPLVALSRTDFAAFLVARHALDALGDTPHAAHLATVTERLAAFLPDAVRVTPDSLTRTLRIEGGPRPRSPLPFYDLIEQATREQRVVHLTYTANADGETTERDVEPLLLLGHQGRWYLVAFCRLRQALRHFRLDRIGQTTLRQEVFTRQGDLDAYLDTAFGVHYDERTYPVHVRFSPYQARWIKEEHWHDTQVLVERADGSLDLRMQVTGLTDVARWVLSYGGEAEVISPPVLRQRVAVQARRMATLYADVPKVHFSEEA